MRILISSLPEVTVDANQIQQVFINLLVNAADAIGDNGGKISIDPVADFSFTTWIGADKNRRLPQET